jgi:hypothetical protein
MRFAERSPRPFVEKPPVEDVLECRPRQDNRASNRQVPQTERPQGDPERNSKQGGEYDHAAFAASKRKHQTLKCHHKLSCFEKEARVYTVPFAL